MITASVVLVTGGLPNRADYSGRVIEGLGRVAPEIGEIAPPFEQATLTGDTINLLDLRGESVIVNFWATWCTPCIAEMPALQAFHDDSGIRILGVNMAEQQFIVEQWIAANLITFDILLDPQGQVIEDYRLRGQPSTYVIAPDGIITHIFYGPVSMDDLRNALITHNNG
ncbi:MAG: TlpA disulfide reductase family protein [Anaerolineae bacterium]|nr:TlpA disulfide reductase family protein [Anaerolineae bacterium]